MFDFMNNAIMTKVKNSKRNYLRNINFLFSVKL